MKIHRIAAALFLGFCGASSVRADSLTDMMKQQYLTSGQNTPPPANNPPANPLTADAITAAQAAAAMGTFMTVGGTLVGALPVAGGACRGNPRNASPGADGNKYSCIAGQWRIVTNNTLRQLYTYNNAGDIVHVAGMDGSTYHFIAGQWRMTHNAMTGEDYEYDPVTGRRTGVRVQREVAPDGSVRVPPMMQTNP